MLVVTNVETFSRRTGTSGGCRRPNRIESRRIGAEPKELKPAKISSSVSCQEVEGKVIDFRLEKGACRAGSRWEGKQEQEGRKEEEERERKGKGLEGDATQNERQATRQSLENEQQGRDKEETRVQCNKRQGWKRCGREGGKN